MNVLVVGAGGREHAISWKVKNSPLINRLYALPSNAGILQIAECIEVSPDDFKNIARVVKDNKIQLVIVGPEMPLAKGIIDFFKENLPKVKIFGPNKNCSQLESSKSYTKEMAAKIGIPQAKYNIFTSYTTALQYIASKNFPVVIKADGLAFGKGTVIVNNIGEAKKVLNDILVDKKFEEAGAKVVVEEFLTGKEISYMIITDNESVLTLPPVRDFKRLLDGNKGSNTGGMGAISPLTDFTNNDELETTKKIILPTLSYLKSLKERYRGVLYAGLMKTSYDIKLLEYNIRFGDPETQCIIPLIKNDIVEIILKCLEGKLKETELQISKKFSCCVCLVSGGYPEKYTTGYEIAGLDEFKDKTDIFIFHAGTKKIGEKIVTSGGRVINVVAVGNTQKEAVEKAYQAVSKIKFEKMFFRKDIGWE